MDPTDPPPKLRMAPPETADELARSCQREQRAANVQRESNLFQSLAPFRAGSVRYLNAVPLTRGLEEMGHVLYKQGKIPGSFYTGRGNEAAQHG